MTGVAGLVAFGAFLRRIGIDGELRRRFERLKDGRATTRCSRPSPGLVRAGRPRSQVVGFHHHAKPRIKTLLPELSNNPNFEQMFLDEARLASRLQHPNVVQVIDLGEEDDVPYQPRLSAPTLRLGPTGAWVSGTF